MQLNTRIGRLETAMNLQADACHQCGYPATVRVGGIVTFGDDPLPTCSGCGRSLDYQGKPMSDPYSRVCVLKGERAFTRR